MRTNWKIMNEGGYDLNLKRYRRFLQEGGYRESTVEGYLSYIEKKIVALERQRKGEPDYAVQSLDCLSDQELDCLEEYAVL
jgi:hypothetical protein